jgi:hypothetical protein
MAQITNENYDESPSITADTPEQDIHSIKDNLDQYNQRAVEETKEALKEETADETTEEESADVYEEATEPEEAADETTEETTEEESAEVYEEATEPEEAADEVDASEEEAEVEVEDTEFYDKCVADFAGLRTLPFIDLYAQKNQAIKNVGDLESSKEMVDQVGDISEDTYSTLIAQGNALDDAPSPDDLKKSVNEFYDKYDELNSEAHRIETLLNRMIGAIDHTVTASTSFISKSMLESAAIRKSAMEKNEEKPTNHALILKRLDITAAAYGDRTNFDVLFNKLRYPNNVLEIFKKFMKSPEDAMKYVNKVFMPVFNDKNMTKFRRIFTSMVAPKTLPNQGENLAWTSDKIDVFVFFLTYWLAHVFEAEYESGKCAYVKTLVMNFYDCEGSGAIYDLPGGPSYMVEVGFLLLSVLNVVANGGYTEKQLHKAINAMMDDLMPILAKEKATLVEQFPGKTIEGSTTFADLCPGVTIDEILADLNKDGTPVDSEEEETEEDSDDDESEETESDEEPAEEETAEEEGHCGSVSCDDYAVNKCPHCVENGGTLTPSWMEEKTDAEEDISNEETTEEGEPEPDDDECHCGCPSCDDEATEVETPKPTIAN